MQQLTFTAIQLADIQQQVWQNKTPLQTIAAQYGVSEAEIADAISNQAAPIHATAQLSIIDIDRIIEMGWEDRTPFDAIQSQFGISEAEVIKLMRQHMKPSSFRMWRKRVTNRITKHSAKHAGLGTRFKCSLQKQITLNKMSKR